MISTNKADYCLQAYHLYPPVDFNLEDENKYELLLTQTLIEFGLEHLFQDKKNLDVLINILVDAYWLKEVTSANYKEKLVKPIGDLKKKLVKLNAQLELLGENHLELISRQADPEYKSEHEFSSIDSLKHFVEVKMSIFEELVENAIAEVKNDTVGGREPWKRYLAKALAEYLQLMGIPLNIRQSTDEDSLPLHYRFVIAVSMKAFTVSISQNTITEVTQELKRS